MKYHYKLNWVCMVHRVYRRCRTLSGSKALSYFIDEIRFVRYDKQSGFVCL